MLRVKQDPQNEPGPRVEEAHIRNSALHYRLIASSPDQAAKETLYPLLCLLRTLSIRLECENATAKVQSARLFQHLEPISLIQSPNGTGRTSRQLKKSFFGSASIRAISSLLRAEKLESTTIPTQFETVKWAKRR